MRPSRSTPARTKSGPVGQRGRLQEERRYGRLAALALPLLLCTQLDPGVAFSGSPADLPAADWPAQLVQAADLRSQEPACASAPSWPRLERELRVVPAPRERVRLTTSTRCADPQTLPIGLATIEAHLTNAAGERAAASGDLVSAEHSFGTALLLDPGHLDAGLNLASLLLQEARADLARVVLLPVLRRSPLPLYVRLLDQPELFALVAPPEPHPGRARLTRDSLDSAWVAVDASRTVLATLSSSLLVFQGRETAPILSQKLVLAEDRDEDEQFRTEALGRLSARITAANRLLAALGLEPLQPAEAEVGWAEQYGERTVIPFPKAGLRLEADRDTVRLRLKQTVVLDLDANRREGAAASSIRWGVYVPMIKTVVYQTYRRDRAYRCPTREEVHVVRLPPG